MAETKSSSSLTFYGGVNEIGGNKILLEDKGIRAWFDFGRSFTFGNEFFTDWLKPRWTSPLKDLFEFNLLPKLPGLYRKNLLKDTDLKYEKPQFDAVFLSHAHLDHMGQIGYLDESIPIYLGEGTKSFVECYEKTSYRSDFGEHVYRTFKTGKKIRIDHLEIEPIHVDHSIPAAYGFIIHTSKGTITYTGDLRMHGPMAMITKEFLNRAKQEKPICLISEGTRVAPKDKRRNLSERQVYDKAIQIANGCEGVIITTSNERNVDRLKIFHEVAINTGRQFVITPRVAYLMDRLSNHMKVPDVMKGRNIRIYFKRKKSGMYDGKDYNLWERPLLQKRVTLDEIRQRQSEYIFQLPFYDFAEMIDLRPSAGSCFIHSMSEPFNEADINYGVMLNWIRHFKLRFHQLHASGHASMGGISAMIKGIKPGRILPVHTEHPEMFKTISGESKTVLPKSGVRIEL